jgi:predicted Zn finger-like uncharacterized protein
MILTCPSCATRYQADAAKFPADGRQVRCAKCGHVWHQAAPAAEAPPPPVTEPAAVVSAPALVAQPEEPSPPDTGVRPWPKGPMRPSPSPAAKASGSGTSFAAGLGIALGWIGLIAVVLLIGLAAVRYRQEITAIWPQSAGVYSRLGMKVNAHGVDLVHVEYHRESEDGQVVLAVTGCIVNNGTRELPVPQNMRITLNDDANHELYHWDYTPSARTLKPGQSIPFMTRLSSPPAGARHLDVRFAKDNS